ncbi:MAG: FAD-dependent oxidoreductase [Scytonema sp. PMC 1070.18]|nr:FAD-dependent oxidoreductase [Scytonema sp. PMC 1070.18]
MKVDYLIVGSGLTGATIARILADAGRQVVVVDRRLHLGGNVHDYAHSSGIRIHAYGPHYFRTSSESIWKFVNRFTSFYTYEAILKSYVDSKYENWPIAGSYICRTIGEHWQAEFKGTPSNFEEASLAIMPRLIYEKFIKEYTEKQWGVPAHTLSASLAKRFDVHSNDDPRLKQNKYQGIPNEGYSNFVNNMLKDIPVILNFDYLRQKDLITAEKMTIFTGPIDEFFDFDMGRLAYRGQQREHVYIKGVDYAFPAGQINNPSFQNGPHIRTLEWKHMMSKEYAECIHGTVLTKETPFSPTHPDSYEYPFPDEANASLYQKYRERAEKIPKLLICGRLGEYKYYDMDQAIAKAMVLAKKLLEIT